MSPATVNSKIVSSGLTTRAQYWPYSLCTRESIQRDYRQLTPRQRPTPTPRPSFCNAIILTGWQDGITLFPIFSLILIPLPLCVHALGSLRLMSRVNHSPSLSTLFIHWGSLSQSNSKPFQIASFDNQLALGSPVSAFQDWQWQAGHYAHSAFLWFPGIWTLVLTFVQWVLSLLSHSPSPMTFVWYLEWRDSGVK